MSVAQTNTMEADRIAIPRRRKMVDAPPSREDVSSVAASTYCHSLLPPAHGRSPLGGEPVLSHGSGAADCLSAPASAMSAGAGALVATAPPSVSSLGAASLSASIAQPFVAPAHPASAPQPLVSPPPTSQPLSADPRPALPSPLLSPRLTGCRDANEFEVLAKIGEGTFGVVTRARDPRTGELVALKKIKFIEQWKDFPITTMREIRALRQLRHPNVVELKEVVVTAPPLPVGRLASAAGSHVAAAAAAAAATTAAAAATNATTNAAASETAASAPFGDVFMVFPYAEHDLAGA